MLRQLTNALSIVVQEQQALEFFLERAEHSPNNSLQRRISDSLGSVLLIKRLIPELALVKEEDLKEKLE
jgi:hypothetical protein